MKRRGRELVPSLIILLFLASGVIIPYVEPVSGSSSGVFGPPQRADYEYAALAGIFQLSSANHTNVVLTFPPKTLGKVNLSQSLISLDGPGYDVQLSLSYDSIYLRHQDGGNTTQWRGISQETAVVRVMTPDMELFHNGSSLGHYFLWLPGSLQNSTVIPRYLTVLDILGRAHDLAGDVLEKSGLDYVMVQNEDPYISLINVYNASTGAAVSLMMPGPTGLSVPQLESGNFTGGQRNVAYTPLGALMNLSYFDFFALVLQGHFVASEHAAQAWDLASFETAQFFARDATGGSQPSAVGAEWIFVLLIPAAAVVLVLLFKGKTQGVHRGRKARWARK